MESNQMQQNPNEMLMFLVVNKEMGLDYDSVQEKERHLFEQYIKIINDYCEQMDSLDVVDEKYNPGIEDNERAGASFMGEAVETLIKLKNAYRKLDNHNTWAEEGCMGRYYEADAKIMEELAELSDSICVKEETQMISLIAIGPMRFKSLPDKVKRLDDYIIPD